MADGRQDFFVDWSCANDMLVRFAPVLTVPDQYHRRPEITGIPNEAARVAHGAGRVREHFEIIFRWQIDQRAQPIRFGAFAENSNRFADVVGPSINIRPQYGSLLSKVVQS